IPLLRGRDFQPGDFLQNAPPVLVVNETLARTRFNGEDAIGKTLGPVHIVGVVKDSKYISLRGETPPTSYVPFLAANTGRGQMIPHVRTSIDPQLIIARVREEV